ncbi:MAG: hypothetical protein IKF07_05825 [Eubacterium sp.]|nr:hypothetical protein [Eubacterium sp.]
MNRSIKKLRSGKGASITFALLLFLVCAVLSSIIITAASAATGRISNMAETDQRYYSVTSASILLKDLICDKTVTVVDVTPEGGSSSRYVLEDVSSGEATANYSSYTPIGTTYTPSSIVSDIACRYYNILPGQPSITITGPVDGTEPAVETVLQPSKKEMTMAVSKYSGSSTHPFVMEVVFKADVTDSTSTKEVEDDDGSITPISIRTRSITWSLKSMKII